VPRRRRRARRRPPVRGAAGGGDGVAALHPPRPLRAQTPPRSWSSSLGPARLSLGPPAPLPASAAAARSLTAPAWIRPLPTRIRRRTTTTRDDGLHAGVGRRRRSAGSPVAALCPLPRYGRGRVAASPGEASRAGRRSDGWFPPSRIVHLRFDFF
jgi:hypothetical protein